MSRGDVESSAARVPPAGGGDWRPSASVEMLRLRARTLARIRAFFDGRGLLEVETPLLASSTASDPHIASLELRSGAAGRRLFLQSSPEFAMKRMLAAGGGPLYQICKAFRAGEEGRLHGTEFTIVEWYRPGFDVQALMDEVEDLVGVVLGPAEARRMTYAEAFREYAGLDPFRADLGRLRSRAREFGVSPAVACDLDRDACLDLILAGVVQPALAPGRVFVHDFPASQASLARVRPGEPPVAERFELFVDGIELANGYHELANPHEQRARFLADGVRRRRRGLADVPVDERLLDALHHGLPDCAGVALGFDRLILVAAGAGSLDEVLPFSSSRI